MSRKGYLCSLAVAAGIFTMSCFLMNLRPQMDVTGYQGDGTVSQIRSAESPGFKIDFATFSLATPYKARFRLDALPERHAAIQYEAGLVVDLAADEASQYPPRPSGLMKGDHGSVAMTLEDASGTKLFQGEAKLTTFGWSAPGNLPLGHISAWYYRQDEGAHPRNQPWFLAVAYSPGADSVNRRAHIRFIGGGWH